MPTITIDGKKIETRDGIPVLRAALEAGLDVPHYCYHPGLTIVASCRLCLMQQKMPDPKTKEMVWSPKLLPSCQTPIKDGMEVSFAADLVKRNQERTLEYYLLNHPLDCPVCDKAGECYLQDYVEDYGPAASRMVEEKVKNPKKDIGSHTLLYQDRCVLCTRCVRFTQEIAGQGELAVVNRGNRGEIDVFPGVPLENKLQGNVVDLCPVGALLDKEFLFKQRVWLLEPAPSICPNCSTGCTVLVDQNENEVHRLRPRFNEKVNEWWMCDEGRFGWNYIHSPQRLRTPRIRDDRGLQPARWEELPIVIRDGFTKAAQSNGRGIAAVLSPMLSCEEAWLLAKFVRSVAPDATLVGGFVPVVGQDEIFKKGFTIRSEKCPNSRGVEQIIKSFGGPALSFDDFLKQTGNFSAVFLTGGYRSPWLSPAAISALSKVKFLVTHDLFASPLEANAAVEIPATSFAEREGSFVNTTGILQPFDRAIAPLEGLKADGQFFFELAGETGLFRAMKVRTKMAAAGLPDFAKPFTPRPEPQFAH